MSNLEPPPPSIKVKNDRSNRGAQGVFNAPIHFNYRSNTGYLFIIPALLVVLLVVGLVLRGVVSTSDSHLTNTQASVSTSNGGTSKSHSTVIPTSTPTATPSSLPLGSTATPEARFPYSASMSDIPIVVGHWEASGPCSILDGILTAQVAQKDNFRICLNLDTDARNFALRAQMTINSGDCGGLVLHSGGSSSPSLYAYVICTNNSFRFIRHLNNSSELTLVNTAIPSSSGILMRLHQTYSIAVVATSSMFTLYINNQQMYAVSDPNSSFPITSGTIGILVKEIGSPTSADFSNVQIDIFAS